MDTQVSQLQGGRISQLFQEIKTKLGSDKNKEDETLIERIMTSYKYLQEINQKKVLFKNMVTFKDRESMPADEAIELDKRSFKIFFKTLLFTYHPIFNMFTVKSLMLLSTLRIAQLFLYISLTCALNAIFYTDDYIESTAYYAIKGNKISYLLTCFLCRNH